MSGGGRRLRLNFLIRTFLFALTLAVGVGLASFPVSTWFDQQDELEKSQDRLEGLVTEIETIDADIQQRVGPEGVAKAAKCFGPYVESGSEVYSVPGVEGCVSVP